MPPLRYGLSNQQIIALARKQANATLAPDIKALEAERVRAREQAAADQAKMTGLAKAQSEMLPAIYGQAATVQTQAASGVSDSVKAALAKMEGAPAQGTADALNYIGGFLPSSTMADRGAAAAQGALGQGAIGVRSSIHQANVDDKKILDSLAVLRAKRPDLVEQAINQIADINLRARAQALYEQQYGLDVRKQGEVERSNKSQERLEFQGLQVRSANDLADAQAAAQRGQQVNASASKALGYLVDQHGNKILGRNGKKIIVPDDARGGGAGSKKLGDAIKEARDLRGEPMENPNHSPYVPGLKGQYLAREDAKGVFRYPGRPPTTNDPSKAKYDTQYSFVEAQGYLMDVYGLSRKVARRALVRAGWKPDGVRTQPRGKRPKDTSR